MQEFYVQKLNFKQVPPSKMSDLTYDMILNKIAAGEDEYGSYGDSEDGDEWGESSGEEGASPQRTQRRPRRNETYEKAIFELIEQK